MNAANMPIMSLEFIFCQFGRVCCRVSINRVTPLCKRPDFFWEIASISLTNISQNKELKCPSMKYQFNKQYVFWVLNFELRVRWRNMPLAYWIQLCLQGNMRHPDIISCKCINQPSHVVPIFEKKYLYACVFS